ncbi:DNA-binding protein ABF2 KNAG_0C05790 [Huiozyma naganishii CBS 8797]|uniref:HMG box domain-containing protein n=1 Tax=Huiozyma naganishii (strain ATCC MYA-139 / BCRC 22969 / CBS 8797 / KCTC 17520 / NBRC 10181 / NCYC 3082 / Yp74L-3) TaxID=1071383 RepID=J7RX86_HUIN7|nr:hypothetical protein KNAG_0C05790 [Kazachstania naganishii CBS 8797]CCK69677.1 hypothetical protein KNAG_0C05790 [Kazachstania naganishii CBS 8797]
MLLPSSVARQFIVRSFQLLPRSYFHCGPIAQWQASFTLLKSVKKQAKPLTPNQSRLNARKDVLKQAPKRPMTAYLLYCKEIRPGMKKENPDLKTTELTKLFGEKWSELSEQARKPFVEQYEKDFAEYQKEKAAFEKTLPPKKPAAPFFLFTKDVRSSVVDAHPDATFGEISTLVSQKWNSMEESKKEEYHDLYKKQLKEWEDAFPEFSKN